MCKPRRASSSEASTCCEFAIARPESRRSSDDDKIVEAEAAPSGGRPKLRKPHRRNRGGQSRSAQHVSRRLDDRLKEALPLPTSCHKKRARTPSTLRSFPLSLRSNESKLPAAVCKREPQRGVVASSSAALACEGPMLANSSASVCVDADEHEAFHK